MRALIYLLIAASTLWGGYWFFGSSALENGFRSWLDEERPQGLQASYGELATRGFPNRFDTTVTNLDLFDPDSDWGWSAPFFQVFALTYKPNHIIAVWPEQHVIQTPAGKVSVSNDRLRASVVFKPNTALTFDRSVLETENLSLSAESGWGADLHAGQFAVRQSVARANSYELTLDAKALRLRGQPGDFIDAHSDLPDELENLLVVAELEFHRPWDRFAADGQAPAIQKINVENLQINWGKLRLSANGSILVDRAGIPEGRITVSAKNWREMFQIAVSAGMVAPNVSQTIESMLEVLAEMSPDAETLEAPLSFQNGRMSFGPIPIGVAPRLN